jgi:hypothetical protein
MNYTNDYLLKEIDENITLQKKLDRIQQITELTNITPELRFNMIREIFNPK